MTENKRDGTLHRAKTWQIALFAMNNTATNTYMIFMNFISYYLVGFIGVGVVTASSLITAMRIWDGASDPLIGFALDRTNTRFGKNRPFMLLGQTILFISSFLMIQVSYRIPLAPLRFVVFVIFYALYIIGYTFQCVATKSAQTCLTNDPSQRPLFSAFDGIYNIVIYAGFPILTSVYLVPKHGGFTIGFFSEYWIYTATLSMALTILSVIAIAEKDTAKYYGMGKEQQIQLKDYWEVIKGNKAIRMLVISASTDKLASNTRTNSVASVIVFGVICGSYELSGMLSVFLVIPTLIILLLGINIVARRMGLKKAMVTGSAGGLICALTLFVSFYLFDPTTLSLPLCGNWSGKLSFYTVFFMVFYLLYNGLIGISSNIVIPMTADCSDYEVYRSGKYVPGLMGSLFSFVDKFVSSLSATIIGLLCAAVGYKDALPSVDSPLSPGLKFVGLFFMFGIVAIALTANLVAMHYYPLTKEKMEEVQASIAEMKKDN